MASRCSLTPRSSRAPTAWHAGQHAPGLRPIVRMLSSAPRCRCRLNSNVRPHNKARSRTIRALRDLGTLRPRSGGRKLWAEQATCCYVSGSGGMNWASPVALTKTVPRRRRHVRWRSREAVLAGRGRGKIGCSRLQSSPVQSVALCSAWVSSRAFFAARQRLWLPQQRETQSRQPRAA